MKKIKQYTLLFSLVILIGSCTEVEFKNSEPPGGPPNGSRRTLIMDFTGHLCAGCPGAAKNANEIAAIFPDHVLVLAVHPDLQGLTAPLDGPVEDGFTTDWRTPEGSHYQSIYNMPGAIPLGVISGLEINGNYWSQTIAWQDIINELIFQERPVTADFTVDYDEITRELNICSSVVFQQDLDGAYNIILATVENNIIDWQLNGSSFDFPADPDFAGGNIPNYIHKHVLRNHVNGLTGDIVVSDGAVDGESHDFNHSTTLSEEYVAEEVSIYAYVYNTETLEIIDVVEHHIID